MDRRSQRKAEEQYQQQQVESMPPPAQTSPAQTSPARTSPTAPPPGDDLVSKLQELAKLHQTGILSDEEFAAAKARLLA